MRRIWRNSGQTIECVPCDLTGANRMGLVGDGIEDTENDKGYTVVEGGKEASVVMRRNARISGRKRQVKKNRGDLRMMNRLTTEETQSVTVE